MSTNTAREVSRLLDGLIDRLDGADSAVVLSRDGLPIAATRRLAQEDSEHLSALVAGVQGLARGACRHFGGGEVLQTVIEMESELLFMVSGPGDTCLAVLTDADSDAGSVAYEMTDVARRLGAYVPTTGRR